MGQLIDDLLTFSRIGRQPISPIRFDMNDLARSVVDETRRQHQGREFEVAIDSLPPAVGERALLKQVLANYVQNAAKFTRKRASARIEIGHSAANGENIYFVRDNGVGFDMRYVDKLFGVFQRLHSADEFEGTGVGLAIVQRIIQRHGGRVWAEAAVNDGATFYFTLPRESESAAEAQKQLA
jgi:two-component system sensor kinase